MQAVIYIAHGTRVQEGIEEAKAFVERAKKHIAIPLQEICFLELVKPSIEQTISTVLTKVQLKLRLFLFCYLLQIMQKRIFQK